MLRGKIDDSIIDEGYVEHDGAKLLINDLATAHPGDDFAMPRSRSLPRKSATTSRK